MAEARRCAPPRCVAPLLVCTCVHHHAYDDDSKGWARGETDQNEQRRGKKKNMDAANRGRWMDEQKHAMSELGSSSSSAADQG